MLAFTYKVYEEQHYLTGTTKHKYQHFWGRVWCRVCFFTVHGIVAKLLRWI